MATRRRNAKISLFEERIDAMKYVLDPSVVIVEAEGGGIALDKRTGAYFQIDSIGLRILRSIGQSGTTEYIEEELTSQFPGHGTLIPIDVRRFVDDLFERALLKLEGE